MPANHESSQQRPTQKSARTNKGQRCVLSARAQSALMWILEDIIAKTLQDSSQLAESAGKRRVELADVEEALKRLCERYHSRWTTETAAAKTRTSTTSGKSNAGKSDNNGKHSTKRLG